MVLSSTQEQGPSLMLIEGCLTAIVFALAFRVPRLGSAWFSRVERAFAQLAGRKNLAVVVVGFTALLLRLAILPLSAVPQPFSQNDFSFLLSADTFALGRLTNPTPAMWMHFETMHVTMVPTYMSMYFPAEGLVMAASKVLTGHPWYGILAMTALMCAAICWMLQAWLPPTWALFGGLLAILRLGLFSYWINTYSGAGSIAALGGALVLGALPRFVRTLRRRDSILLAVGIVLIGLCRPYDGLLLCIPVISFLAWWALFGKNRPAPALLLRRIVLPLALILAAGAWMGYYDYRVFGNPLTLPYTVDRAQYATAPYFVWQSQRPQPVYRHQVIRDFYNRNELDTFKKIHSPSGFVPQTLVKAVRGILFFAGIALLPPLIMLRRVLLDRRIRFLVVCVCVMVAGQLIEIFLVPHYLAPFTAAFYAIGLQAMRHLRVWRPGGQPVGLTLVRLTFSLCVVLAAVRLYAQPLHIRFSEWPGAGWTSYWSGPGQFGAQRARIESDLDNRQGSQLVIVRYALEHDSLNEWVYNTADIDDSKIVWAREMDQSDNRKLLRFYKNRTVWLVEPDATPAKVSPYPLPTQEKPNQ